MTCREIERMQYDCVLRWICTFLSESFHHDMLCCSVGELSIHKAANTSGISLNRNPKSLSSSDRLCSLHQYLRSASWSQISLGSLTPHSTDWLRLRSSRILCTHSAIIMLLWLCTTHSDVVGGTLLPAHVALGNVALMPSTQTWALR